MKKMGIAAGVLAALAMLFGLTACGPEPEAGEGYSITFTEDTSSLTVEPGETITLNVESSNGTWKVDTENLDTSYVTVETTNDDAGLLKTIAITGVAETTKTTISLYPEEAGDDTSYDVTLNVEVYDPEFTVTLNLSDAIAASAASISVTYSNDSVDDIYTADVDYVANSKTATVKFIKENSNSYCWFDSIIVTVKTSTDVTISTSQSISYFCYEAASGEDGYLKDKTINITLAETSKKFTINFSGFTIPEGSVSGIKYSNTYAASSSEWADDSVTTPNVTVADDGTSASFNVEKENLTSKSEFYIDWTAVVIKDASGNEITLTSGLTDSNKWYSYDGSIWSITAAVVNTSSIKTLLDATSLPEGINSDAPIELVSATSMPESASSIIITYTVGVNDTVNASSTWITAYSDGSWANETKIVNAWVDGFEVKSSGETYSVTITETTPFLSNGIYIASNSADYTGKISVTYAE